MKNYLWSHSCSFPHRNHNKQSLGDPLLNLIKDIDEVFRVQAIHRTKILSASIRYVNSVSQSFANGANIVTMPPSVFDKMYNHVLTDKGLEIFDEDWKNVVHHG